MDEIEKLRDLAVKNVESAKLAVKAIDKTESNRVAYKKAKVAHAQAQSDLVAVFNLTDHAMDLIAIAKRSTDYEFAKIRYQGSLKYVKAARKRLHLT
jgi:predicted methyltransferase